jgi:hypothetical protein
MFNRDRRAISNPWKKRQRRRDSSARPLKMILGNEPFGTYHLNASVAIDS